jgi:phage-related minor tail protein
MADSTARGVTFKLNVDSSGVKSGSADAKAAIDSVAAGAQKSFDSAGKSASSYGAAVEAANKRAADAAKAASSAFGVQGDALAKLLGKIDPTIAGLGKLDDQLAALTKFRSSGAISGEDFAAYAAKIQAARLELTAASTATHGFGLQTNLAQREVAVLAGELARGNTARFESSLITLGRASGVLGLAITGAGAAVLGTIGILAAAAIAYEKGSAEQDAFNKALVATGNYAGVTTGQLFAQATAIGQATGEYGKAEDALTRLAGSGKLTGDALTEAAKGAVALSVLTGQSIEKSVDDFNKLGDDPVKAIVDLNDKYHFLTLAVYDQVKALSDQGDQEAATSLAVKTAADSLDQRRQQIVDNAGAIEKGWIAVKNAVQGAIDNLKQVGRTDADAQLSNAYIHQFDLQAAQNQINAGGFQGFLGRLNAGPKDSFDADVAATNDLIANLQKVKAQTEANDAAAAKDDALQKGAIDAASAIDKMSLSLDKNAEKQKALNDLQRQFKALAAAPGPTDSRLAGVTQDANGNLAGGLIDTLTADINKKFAGPARAEIPLQ